MSAGVRRPRIRSDRFDLLLAARDEVVAGLREVGFRYVTLDLEGFRSGSHNLALIQVGRLR
jgi:pyridinium-3,5-biscarboxylic acid mononucleotide sulfurtransferase